MVLEIPIEMLNDGFLYEEFEGIDRNQTPQYKEPVEIENVRIDRSRTYYRDSEESGVRAEARIYCYASGTEPFIAFKEQARITFDDEEYTLREVSPYSDAFSNDIVAYRLEVV